MPKPGIYARIVKPFSDRLLAGLGLLAISPVLAVLYVLVRWKLGSPVLFRQIRPGKDEAFFEVMKFRTMTSARDARGQLLDDAIRLTPFGKFMRAASLDELPQLWNVFRGDMSLIGPRPLLPEYLPRYSAFQRQRHSVKPGITGLAQVSGRNAISWEEKFRMDVEYAQNLTLTGDLRILWLTFVKVCGRADVNSEGHATAPAFLGTPERRREEHAKTTGI